MKSSPLADVLYWMLKLLTQLSNSPVDSINSMTTVSEKVRSMWFLRSGVPSPSAVHQSGVFGSTNPVAGLFVASSLVAATVTPTSPLLRMNF